MLRIALVNMPFSRLDAPSIGLTQLRHVLLSELPGQVEVDILYLNLDFVRFVGPRLFLELSVSATPDDTAVGEWFFGPAAFPEQPDRSEELYDRCFADRAPRFRSELLRAIRDAPEFLAHLVDRYAIDRYDLVGSTSLFSQHVASFALARELKQRNPELPFIMGGPCCEGAMGRVILRTVPAVDYVFSGPALKSLPAFVRAMLEGEADRRDAIPGVLSRRDPARLAPDAPDEHGEDRDINAVVPLDYDDYLAAFDRLKIPNTKPNLFVETSRGCWWGQKHQCTFCGLNGCSRDYRAMRPEVAVPYLQGMLDRYGERITALVAVDNIMPRDFTRTVLPKLAVPSGVGLFYEVKSNLSDQEVGSLARAGARSVQAGIEALSTASLKLMNKGVTATQNIQLLRSCAVHGVRPWWLILVGFPGETEEVFRTYADLLPLLTHLPPPIRMHRLRFDRFSAYWEHADEYGLKLEPQAKYEMAFPFQGQDLHDAAYHFHDRSHDAWLERTVGPWWPRIQEIIARWRAGWASDDPGLRPRLELCRSGESATVHDSRSGQPVEHQLDTPTSKVLGVLATPHKVAALARALPELSADEVTTALDELRRRGLVFEDGDRFLSLVLPAAGP